MDDPKPQSTEPAPEPQNVNQPYVNEPETHVTPTGEPATIVQSHDPQFAVKRKSGAKKWLLTGVVVLLLAGLGALVYWQWAEAENAKKELTTAQEQLKTAQDSMANSQTDKTTTAPVELSNKDEVVIVAKEFVALRTNNQFNTVSGESVKFDTTEMYARTLASVGNSGAGGYTIIAKKLKDSWVVIYGGVDMTTDQKNNLIKEFTVPESLLTDS